MVAIIFGRVEVTSFTMIWGNEQFCEPCPPQGRQGEGPLRVPAAKAGGYHGGLQLFAQEDPGGALPCRHSRQAGVLAGKGAAVCARDSLVIFVK